ncbi:hypothetical protein [Saccharopolyspora mangrovi]|uniref:Uncharacterized protein n=1 Tax=Saccharopolyspora mangrovi TaxID=3082379 RepID=A0ABU6A4X3_9PSEU|nr:hypothetical protein [Saccharopolyspora sp. S2-29]MEB3366513.1 hypothetical protein [Saccharopolyspora sp. S2-29]
MESDEAEPAEWQRLVDPWITNEHRRGLGETNKAATAGQMELFPLNPDDISVPSPGSGDEGDLAFELGTVVRWSR